ncbi:MAG: hypothetical protein B7Z40_14840 [Bosea sp. 12-68-7]|nr:MAG: hypothetical protein B7Z40_14840 [Bosea sp. 12-68-7]
MRTLFALIAIALSIAGSASAQELTQSQRTMLVSQMRDGMTLPAFVAANTHIFRAADINMDGRVTLADMRLQEEKWPHATWRPRIEEIFRHDTNFDGVVTREEAYAHQQFNYQRNAYLFGAAFDLAMVDKRAADVMVADTNGDGKVEWLEAVEFVKFAPVPPITTNGYHSFMIALLEIADGPHGLTLGRVDKQDSQIN